MQISHSILDGADGRRQNDPMSTPNQTTALSSTYWELHRNTLLFSALLLVICIPGVKLATSQSFLWLSFSNVAFNGLRAIVAIAATYCFVAYWLEWRSEALIILRKEAGLAESSRQRSDDLMQTATVKPAEALETLNQAIEKLTEQLPPQYQPNAYVPPILDEMVQKAVDSFPPRENGVTDLNYMFWHNAPRLQMGGAFTVQSVIEMGFQEINDAARKMAVRTAQIVCDETTLTIKSRLEAVTKAADDMKLAILELNKPVGRFHGLRNQMAWSISLWRIRGFLRLGILGLALPILCYVVAIAHLLGQLGFAHLPSIFTLIQKAPA